ncbi:putative leucine-rich repeat-containing protein DDB_G0290503 [Watersipora subatra]|uniref:putative leucine-rich repeat-containing protein DDB_G0290503 n=1 Tax=Watersipora subatra TaxID=2589382 RepID=UPI00355C8688
MTATRNLRRDERLREGLYSEPKEHSPSSSSSPTAGMPYTNSPPELSFSAEPQHLHSDHKSSTDATSRNDLKPTLKKGCEKRQHLAKHLQMTQEKLPCSESLGDTLDGKIIVSSDEPKDGEKEECVNSYNTIHLTDSSMTCSKVEELPGNPRVGVSTGVKVAPIDVDFDKLEKSLRKQFSKTEKYLLDKEYISSSVSSPRNFLSCSSPSDETTEQGAVGVETLSKLPEICFPQCQSVQGKALKFDTESSSHSSSQQVTPPTKGTVTVKTAFDLDEDTCSTVTLGDMNPQVVRDDEKDQRISELENEVKRLEGEVGIGGLYGEQLVADAQRYKTRYETELEANALASDKLDRSEAKIGKLLSNLSKTQNMLSAAEMELSILRDPQVCRINENGDLKSQLQGALEDRKVAFGQLKSVEKLLEEVITEKDDLLTSNSELKIETNKLRRETANMEQRLKEYETKVKNYSETESALQRQVSEQRDKLLQYQKRHNQVLKEKDEITSKFEEYAAHKKELQEKNDDLQEEVNRLKSRLVKFDSEVIKWEDEMARAHEGQVEELDNWRDLVRLANSEAHESQTALKSLEREHDKEQKSWSEERTRFQTQVHDKTCQLDAAEKRIASLERENDAMSLAITERLPLEIEDTKCALEQAKVDLNKLEEEKVQLLSVLNDSSPTADLLTVKKSLEIAKEEIKNLKEQHGNIVFAIRENCQDELDRLNEQLERSKEKVKMLTADNAEFSKVLTEKHPEELAKVNGLLETANAQIKSLQEQNKDLMYAMSEQSYRIQQCSIQATESVKKKKELSRLLQVATDCNKLNNQVSECLVCRERATSVARLCHDMCIYIEQERKRNKLMTEQSIGHGSEKSASIETTDLEASFAQLSLPVIEPQSASGVQTECKQCKKLKEEIETLKRIQIVGPAEDLVDDTLLSNQVLKNQVNRMEAELSQLQAELETAKTRFQADVDEQIKELIVTHSGVLEKAEISLKKSKSMIAKGKLLADAQRYNSISVPQLIQIVKVDVDAHDTGVIDSDKNKELPPDAKELFNKDKNEKDEDTARPLTAVTSVEGGLAQQKLNEKIKIIQQLTDQNEDLAKQVDALTKLIPSKNTDESEVLTEFEQAKRKLNKQAVEIDQLGKRLTASQQELEFCGKGGCTSASIAYIVRERETEIKQLKGQVAELQRSLVNQSKQLLSDPLSLKRRCRGSTSRVSKVDLADSFAELSRVTSNTNRALVTKKLCLSLTLLGIAGLNTSSITLPILAVLAEENQKLKEQVDQLTNEKENLLNSSAQKEASLVEMRNTLKLHEVAAKAHMSKKELNAYSKKLKEGEGELSRLQVQIATMSQRQDSVFSERDSEIIVIRTNYAQQLSRLINDWINGSESKENEMKQLCDKLDVLEGENFDYVEQMKELSHLKKVTLPKLHADVYEARNLCDESKEELNKTVRKLKESELANNLLRIEKEEAEEICRSTIEKVAQDKYVDKEELENMQVKLKEQIEEMTSELAYVKKELTNALVDAQAKEGSATHWKLQHDQKNRELKDQTEKYEIMLNAKENELRRLRGSHMELQRGLGNPKQETEIQLVNVTKQLKVIQQKHMEVINKTASVEKISEDSLNKLYTEIGELNISLHGEVKELTKELARLQEELENVQSERATFQEECAKMIQDKQIEIRRLNAHIEKTEIEAAKLGAAKEKEIGQLKDELKLKLDKINTEKAHLNVKKGTEASKLKQENDKLVAGQRKDLKIISELREKVKELEKKKGELSMQKETLSTKTEQMKKELERCQADKNYYEKMVERLNGEMETRIASVRQNSTRALQVKDEHTAEVYEKLEKIARDRGNLSTELYSLLQDREAQIESLSLQVEEVSTSLDKAESDFKVKLEKKNKEVKTLRSEIKKMGTEGMKLLEQREKEILEMRSHLRNVLKVMENRTKLSRDSTPALMAQDSANEYREVKHTKSASNGGINQSLPPRLQKSASIARNSLTRKSSKK